MIGGRIVQMSKEGKLATGFGDGGIVETDFDGIPPRKTSSSSAEPQGITCLAIQEWNSPHYRIIVGGYVSHETLVGKFGKYWITKGTGSIFALACYEHIEGRLDEEFGGLLEAQGSVSGIKGIVATDFYYADGERVNAIAIDRAQGIIAAGSGVSGGIMKIALARYFSTGCLDTEFGLNPEFGGISLERGKILLELEGCTSASANSVEIDNEGRIILGCEVVTKDISQYERGGAAIALVRLNGRGQLDRSFGNDGVVITGVEPGSSYIFGQCGQVSAPAGGVAMAVTEGDGIIISGDKLVTQKYNHNGLLDRSWGIYDYDRYGEKAFLPPNGTIRPNVNIRKPFQYVTAPTAHVRQPEATSIAVNHDQYVIVAGWVGFHFGMETENRDTRMLLMSLDGHGLVQSEFDNGNNIGHDCPPYGIVIPWTKDQVDRVWSGHLHVEGEGISSVALSRDYIYCAGFSQGDMWDGHGTFITKINLTTGEYDLSFGSAVGDKSLGSKPLGREYIDGVKYIAIAPNGDIIAAG